MKQLKDLLQMRGIINKSIFIGLLLISIMSVTGCGGEGCTACGTYSYSPASERSSSSSSSGISSIGESSSSSSGTSFVDPKSSSSSSVITPDGSCDSLIEETIVSYSSFRICPVGDDGNLSCAPVGVDTLAEGYFRWIVEVTLTVRKDSTIFSYVQHNEGYEDETYRQKKLNYSCEIDTFTVNDVKSIQLRIYSEDTTNILASAIDHSWDMFSLYEVQYYVMGDSPYIDPIYWEQD